MQHRAGLIRAEFQVPRANHLHPPAGLEPLQRQVFHIAPGQDEMHMRRRMFKEAVEQVQRVIGRDGFDLI